jgi:4-amino-4-deoxy-L-arabinose transferase-like glycosyltransferase
MKHVNRYGVLFATVLIIALLLRVWGINYDLPYIYHPDEPFSMGIIQNIFKTSNFNPHFFNYPSLFFYINVLAYIPYYLLGKILGIFTTRNDILAPISIVMGVTKSQMPSTVLLGRTITLIFGLGTVGITYLIGKQLTGKRTVGLFASLLLAVALPDVNLSRFITPDTFATFFIIASFLGSVLIYHQGKTRYYIFAGICAGFAASTKYNGGLIVLPMILAHFLHYRKHAFANRNIYIGLAISGFAFLAGTPFAAIDFPSFWAGIRYDSLHYSTGHPGMEGDTLKYYLNYMWTTGGIIYALSILGIIRGIYTRSKEIILLSIYPIVYFLFINRYLVRNDRTFLPLTPFLFLLAVFFLDFLIGFFSRLPSGSWRKVSRFGFAALLLLTYTWPLSVTAKNTLRLTSVDSRTTSRLWIADNLPSGTRIAVESYSPFVDPERFSVQGFIRIIDHDPDWYSENGFDYLVFSAGMYGRFYDQPELYRSEVSQYNAFFISLKLVKMFNDGNFEIRIYQVPSPSNANLNHRQMRVRF